MADNFFTNVRLASLLPKEKITMVGAVRSNSKGLTKQMTTSDHEVNKASSASMMKQKDVCQLSVQEKKCKFDFNNA